MAVNRIRYVRKHHSPAYSAAYRVVVLLSELLRLGKPGKRGVVRAVLDESRWSSYHVPSGTPQAPPGRRPVPGFPNGAVIIPAHNEASVIGRALFPLAPLAAGDHVQVIVACNGCTDNTAELARRFQGVTVLDLPSLPRLPR